MVFVLFLLLLVHLKVVSTIRLVTTSFLTCQSSISMIAEERIRANMGKKLGVAKRVGVLGHMITMIGYCIEMEGELRWNSVLHHI